MKQDKMMCIAVASSDDIVGMQLDGADIPKKDKMYTVVNCFYVAKFDLYALQFAELNHGNMYGYNSEYFRPVDESNTEEIIENLEKQFNLEPWQIQHYT